LVRDSTSTPKDYVPCFIHEGFIAGCVFGAVFASRCATRQSAPKIFVLPLDEIFATFARLDFRELAFVS
jgi:hypothetical protein